MVAVRAKATTGFRFGNAAISGLRVKPIARRAGTTSSRALQIVGLSNYLKASRSAGCGRVGTLAFLGSLSSGPRLYWQRPRAARPFGGELDADAAAANQHPERKRQRQNDEHDRQATLGAGPSFPVGDPILHAAPAEQRGYR